MLESFGADGPAAFLVENPEGHPDHVLVIDSPHLGRHHVAELWELNLARAVSVKLKATEDSLDIHWSRNATSLIRSNISASVGFIPMALMA